ncbi:hypothetical protein SDJN03_09003, partial [Cucurbita argyrosperma subsp. sororia]
MTTRRDERKTIDEWVEEFEFRGLRCTRPKNNLLLFVLNLARENGAVAKPFYSVSFSRASFEEMPPWKLAKVTVVPRRAGTEIERKLPELHN